MADNDFQNLWGKLKSRNVYRAAIAYSITAWLLVQIASIILPAFEAPLWVLKVVILLLILGLPIALLLAWFYEMTPDGLKRSDTINAQESKHGGKVARNIIYVVLSLSVLYLLYDKFFIPDTANDGTAETIEVYIPEKSIAVLPFKNLSAADENEYFSDGIMEAILNNLSRLKDIKVVSRTSVERYRESKLSIPQIGKELEIAYVLEGSVQRSKDRVRITAQLISAKNDKHLWSENYDRDLEDVFEIQTEIANAISDNLKLLITSNERELMENAPTTNLKAFDLYLQAMHVEQTSDNLDEETKLLKQALSLDPDFFYPYIEIADNIINQSYSELTPDDVWKDTVLTLIDKAIDLSPKTDLLYNYKGYYYNLISEPEKSLFCLYKAFDLNPNEPYYQVGVGNDKLKKGLIDEGVELKLKALTSIPEIEVKESIIKIRNFLYLLDSEFRHNFSLQLNPDFIRAGYLIRKRKYESLLEYRLSQNLLVNANGKVILAQAYSFNDNYDEAIALYEERMDESVGSNQGHQKYGFEHRYGYALIKAGERTKGRQILNSHADTIKTSISTKGIKTGSEYYDLALINANLGEKDKAIEWLKTDLKDPKSNYKIVWYLGDNMLDAIREEPEFKAIIKDILDKETAVSKVFHEKLQEYQTRGELLWLTLDGD